jgi:anti-sigma factor RsiW
MCEYSGRLIAWMDGELPGEEAAKVERHVQQCAECRRSVNAYEEVGGAFVACYKAAMIAQPRRTTFRWAVGGLAAAAAIVAAVLLVQPRNEQIAAFVPPPPHAPAMAFEKPPGPMVRVRSRPRATHTPVLQPWIAVEPSVEVALPADALFPPGAVPEGFSFIADVRP